jgi:ribosomal protein S18 acetylase RimI-like enzyme
VKLNPFFIDADYRGLGIGDLLMQKALFWMDHEGVNAKILEVAAGNEGAFGFYARYGFLPRKILQEQENDLHETYFSKGHH